MSCAQCSSGYCYANVYGVEKSMEKAVEWYTIAAENGNPTAQFKLANCYFDGDGIKKSNKEGCTLSLYPLNKAGKNPNSITCFNPPKR